MSANASPALPGSASTVPPGSLWIATAAVFVGAFAGCALFYARHPLLYDSDSSYHLAIARAVAHQGPLKDLAWLRFSTLHQGFGDKEMLFHLLLAPFAALPDPLLGGRLFLALCDALIAAALAHLALRAVGWWGLLTPLWLAYSDTEVTWRAARLRPELLSLFLLLAAFWAIARARYRWLGFLAALYGLTYTAFHAFLGMCGILFLVFGWARRRWEWGLLLYPLLGVGLALVAHPNFPKNLEVWIVQNVQFFVRKEELDIGTEFRPNFTDVALMVQLGWLLGLLAVWRSGAPAADAPPQEAEARAADAFGTAAVVFGVLYLLMSRFALYCFPFATLWMLFEMRRRGRLPSRWTALPWRGRVPLGLALGLCALISLPVARRELALFARRTDPGPGAIRFADRAEIARALPPGARVAAPWRSTPIYMLWAPQGLYLNALDPVFMATPYPQAYAAQRAVFEGTEPDVPLAVARDMDSEFLAFPTTGETATLIARLEADPRIHTLYRQFNGVYRVLAGANRDFVLEWRVAPESTAAAPRLPLGGEVDPAASWPPYPLDTDAMGRAFEGYVDGRRIGRATGCVGLVHDVAVTAPTRIDYELAPSGPTALRLDGDLVVSTERSLDAVLGQGLVLPVTLQPGRHRLFVHTCVSGGHIGFYLLERKPR